MPTSRVMNYATRRLQSLFPGYFAEVKHNHYADFGWPTQVSFDLLYSLWDRNALANAVVKKTASKCWRDDPVVRETEQYADDETTLEGEIRQRFRDLRVWQRLVEADRRSMVGRYAGVILRLADGKRFSDPVESVPGGLDGLAEIIPAWEGQLEVSTWDTDEASETYGHPLMYAFNEMAVATEGEASNQPRSFKVHPSRVIIWSNDGTLHGRSLLTAGYNDLMTVEKVTGAGGEGFWKNAKSAPHLNIDVASDLESVAEGMGFEDLEAMVEAMNENVEAWQKGFDKVLMTQGMTADTLQVTLPSPEHFYGIALQNFASSVEIPVKIVVGMQTGERASQEDAQEWSETCQSRRTSMLIPNIREFINRLENFRILPERDWEIAWNDLTESTMGEKIERGEKMANINRALMPTGELAFLPEEIREALDMKPLGAGAFIDGELDDELSESIPEDEIDDEDEESENE